MKVDCHSYFSVGQAIDVAERLLPVEGHLHPSSAPGVGVQIDEDKLARYRTDQ